MIQIIIIRALAGGEHFWDFPLRGLRDIILKARGGGTDCA